MATRVRLLGWIDVDRLGPTARATRGGSRLLEAGGDAEDF